MANGELFRIYPGNQPGRSITVHQNSTPLDLSEESVAAGAQAVFEYAHATVRDEDYKLVEGLQANLESGARDQLLFGRNEPDCSIATSPGPRHLHGQLLLADSTDSTAIRSSRMVASASFWPGRTPVNSSTASLRRPAATNGTS